ANLQLHVALERVDAVVLSHEHPDHWSDLEGWNIVLQHFLDRDGFPVYAPAGLKERTYDGMPTVAWHDVGDGHRVTIGTLDATFSRTDHGPETLAVRIEAGGRSLGYSADTGPGWSLEALGPGLDLSVCEASLPTEQEGVTSHLSARQAGEQARAAGAARLVLTHLWPTIDPDRARGEGAAAFGSDVEIAAIGARYEV
ncbi:MAG: MBL fold metallo-hydrolase, partial [Actinomycetota bacterium]|nr:MBL fold metallo-hydrolase [Actinomycetota bacterium]